MWASPWTLSSSLSNSGPSKVRQAMRLALGPERPPGPAERDVAELVVPADELALDVGDELQTGPRFSGTSTSAAE